MNWDKFWYVVGLLVLLFVVVLILPHFMQPIDLIGSASNTTYQNITASYNATYATNMTAQPFGTAFEIGWSSLWFWLIIIMIVLAIYFAWKNKGSPTQ